MTKVSTQTVSERNKVSTQTVSKINKASNVKQEESEYNIKEKNKAIPCKYFHRKMGCRRGDKCWFYHGDDHITEKNSTKLKKKKRKKLPIMITCSHRNITKNR